MTCAAYHGADYGFARARWLLLLMPMDEHMHSEVRLDGWQRIAGAPSRRQATAWAAGGPGEYDASSHTRSCRRLRRLHQPFVAEPGFDDIGHLAGLIFKFFQTFFVAIGVGAAGE